MASAAAGPQAFLVGGARTPVGRYGGALSAVRPMTWPPWWSARPSPAPALDPDSIDEVILGNANGAGEENRNVARMATLLAGLPLHIPGITVNRLCASGLSAIIMASHMIKSGAADIVIAGGVESMSRAPWVQEKPQPPSPSPAQIFDTSIGWRFANPLFSKGELSRDGKMTYSMPETAEEVARVDGISREDADAFAVRSHERSLAAIAAGRFADEIVPVTVKTRKSETVVDTDEGPRAGTTMDVLAGLRPVVAGGSVVTAGNSSTLNDGASAIIVASEAAIQRLASPRGPASSTAPPPAANPRSWASARSPPPRRCSTGAVSASATSAPSNLTKRSPPSRWPACGGLGWTRTSSTTTAAPSPWATRSVPAAHGSPSPCWAGWSARTPRIGLATMCIGVGQGTAMLLERV